MGKLRHYLPILSLKTHVSVLNLEFGIWNLEFTIHYSLFTIDHSPLFLIMYSKTEASKLRQEFWTSFGQYMLPVLSADGEKVNWINYKTGLKDFAFRMDADNKTASIAIELTHNDNDLQQLYFEQLEKLKHLLEQCLGETWDWKLRVINASGKTVSRIEKTLEGVSIYRKEDWPELISFFKPRIIALDDFWSNARYSLEEI
jgi:hypothetical protein